MTSPSGSASASPPPVSKAATGRGGHRVRSASQSSTASVTASPASARRSATAPLSPGVAVQPRTATPSTSRSGRRRCSCATAVKAWRAVSTPLWSGRPALRRLGRQQPDRQLAVLGPGDQVGGHRGCGEARDGRLPGVRVADPLPHEVAEQAGAQVVVVAVREDHQPAVRARC